jgi:hypothetical protein
LLIAIGAVALTHLGDIERSGRGLGVSSLASAIRILRRGYAPGGVLARRRTVEAGRVGHGRSLDAREEEACPCRVHDFRSHPSAELEREAASSSSASRAAIFLPGLMFLLTQSPWMQGEAHPDGLMKSWRGGGQSSERSAVSW